MARVSGQRGAPGAVCQARFQLDLRRDPVAGDIDRPGKGNLAPGDDRHFVAQPFGVGDDMGGENDRGAFRGLGADDLFELTLVERVEAGKRLVEDYQPRLMDQRAQQLHLLRHALGQLADLAVGGMAQAVFLQQRARAPTSFGQRQPAQCAEKSYRVIGLHRRIQPALLGQIADQMHDFLRAFVAEHAAQPAVGIDDAQQDAQRGGLAGAIGAENAVDQAFGHRQVDAIDRDDTVETLDQPARLDRQPP